MSPTYVSWMGMRQRCDNLSRPNSKNHGRRGITYPKKWATFAGFLEDMGVRPEGLSLERIDNNKNYSKQNCKWATRFEQQRNMRTNVHIRYRGKDYVMVTFAEKIGLPYRVVKDRRLAGWSPERIAATTTIRGR